MSSHSNLSWRYTVFGVLAGVGAGYILGMIGSKWLRKRTDRPRPGGSQPPRDSELVAALAALTSEVASLRQAIELNGLERGSRRSTRRVESIADFVSAQGEDPDESDDEGSEAFFDIATPSVDNIGGSVGAEKYSYVDELGKKTLESEESCSNLVEQLRARLEEHPDDAGLLWRLARTLVHLSIHLEQRGETEEEKQLLQQATDHAQQALSVDPNTWQVHQWYAVAIGSLVKYGGTKEKIEKGFEYKEHIDAAIALNPEDSTLYYLCGRWCFEVAGISWLERKGASALFASPPESSFDDALQNFMKSEELKPNQWKANMLMVAKCHIKLRDVPTAVEWLHKAFQLPNITAEDHGCHKEIQELLAQHDEDFDTEY